MLNKKSKAKALFVLFQARAGLERLGRALLGMLAIISAYTSKG
jgi:hypothetical protein